MNIDWLSVKMGGLTVVTCWISGTAVFQWLGAIAAASTLIYNGIRIYQTLKNKTNEGNNQGNS